MRRHSVGESISSEEQALQTGDCHTLGGGGWTGDSGGGRTPSSHRRNWPRSLYSGCRHPPRGSSWDCSVISISFVVCDCRLTDWPKVRRRGAVNRGAARQQLSTAARARGYPNRADTPLSQLSADRGLLESEVRGKSSTKREREKHHFSAS